MRLFYDNRKAAKRTNVGYRVQTNGDVVLVEDWSSGPSRTRTGRSRGVMVEHVVFEENIFSIEAVCITIHNMHLPFAQNGMLINDTRLGPDCARWLLGDKLAAITQIPASSVDWLLSQGVSLLEVGKIAGVIQCPGVWHQYQWGIHPERWRGWITCWTWRPNLGCQ